jgi:hypothetical protein
MKINGPKRQYERSEASHYILGALICAPHIGFSAAAARTRATAPAYQVGCPEVVPILKATPVWTDVLRDTEWVKRLEEAAPVIREELFALKGKHGFQVSLRHVIFKKAYVLRSIRPAKLGPKTLTEHRLAVTKRDQTRMVSPLVVSQQYRAPSWASSGQNPSQTDGRGGTVR